MLELKYSNYLSGIDYIFWCVIRHLINRRKILCAHASSIRRFDFLPADIWAFCNRYYFLSSTVSMLWLMNQLRPSNGHSHISTSVCYVLAIIPDTIFPINYRQYAYKRQLRELFAYFNANVSFLLEIM